VKQIPPAHQNEVAGSSRNARRDRRYDSQRGRVPTTQGHATFTAHEYRHWRPPLVRLGALAAERAVDAAAKMFASRWSSPPFPPPRWRRRGASHTGGDVLGVRLGPVSYGQAQFGALLRRLHLLCA
jgi:hypothetical protein